MKCFDEISFVVIYTVMMKKSNIYSYDEEE